MLISRRNLVLTGAALAAAPRAWAQDERAGPPLWIARSADSAAYLFGQIPIPADVDWIRPEIDAAFAGSRALWVENPEPDPSAPPPVFPAAAADYSIMRDLSAADQARLRALLEDANIPLDVLQGQSAAAAYQGLSALIDQQTGADFTAIPEAVFKRRADEARVPIYSEWGDMQDIVTFMAETPHATHVETVRIKLDEAERIAGFRARVDAWLAGDLTQWIEDSRLMQARYPAAFERIGAGRNRAWAERVRSLLREPGEVFVCVGLGHLVGEGSIQDFLADTGVSIERV